jgi:hypothetical protein
MDILNAKESSSASSYRSLEERESHGLPYEGPEEYETPISYRGDFIQGEAARSVPKAWGTHGSFQAPDPQVFQSVQRKPELGQEDVYASFDEKIKHPLLPGYAHTKDPEPDTVCQKTARHEKTNNCCCWSGWFW